MPLTFDMPLEELTRYQGTNPRPDDFDDYWARGLAEMHAVDAQVELVPADFQNPVADCFHMYFTGVGGARVHAKLLRPRGQEHPGPAVLMFHGYTGDSGSWLDKLGYVASGFTVAALDCRGQGGLSDEAGDTRWWNFEGQIVRGLNDDSPDALAFRSIFLDTAQLAGLVMALDTVDEARVVATGGSQGGALTIVCAALEPRIARLAPVYPFLSDYKRVWELDLDVDAYSELRGHFRRYDPRHERVDDIFTRLGYIDIQHLAPRIQGEVLISVGLRDQICPPSTQFAAYNKISAPKSLDLYPDFAHEDMKGSGDRIYQFLMGV